MTIGFSNLCRTTVELPGELVQLDLNLSDATHLSIELAIYVGKPLLDYLQGAISLNGTVDSVRPSLAGWSGSSASARKSGWTFLAPYPTRASAASRSLPSALRHACVLSYQIRIMSRHDWQMADDDSSRRIDRLAKRAKELDDMIAKTAKMQKRIIEEIVRLGQRDHVMKQRASSPLKARRKKGKRS